MVEKRHLHGHSSVRFKELNGDPIRFWVVGPVLSEPEEARGGEGIQEKGMALKKPGGSPCARRESLGLFTVKKRGAVFEPEDPLALSRLRSRVQF